MIDSFESDFIPTSIYVPAPFYVPDRDPSAFQDPGMVGILFGRGYLVPDNLAEPGPFVLRFWYPFPTGPGAYMDITGYENILTPIVYLMIHIETIDFDFRFPTLVGHWKTTDEILSLPVPDRYVVPSRRDLEFKVAHQINGIIASRLKRTANV